MDKKGPLGLSQFLVEIVSISDVHVKHPLGKEHDLLCRFLDHDRTQRAHAVILLGDIFDLAIGPYPEYVALFPAIFERLNRLAQATTIYYFQGNHDFLLMDIFKKQTLFRHLGNIEICTQGRVFSVGNKRVYVEHGDDAEIGNYSYKIYKTFINNFFTAFLAKYVFNFHIIHFVGRNLSNLSKKRRNYIHSNPEKIRSNFREAARRVALKQQCDTVILGHCHIADFYVYPDGPTYLNNGYAKDEARFCAVSEERAELVSL